MKNFVFILLWVFTTIYAHAQNETSFNYNGFYFEVTNSYLKEVKFCGGAYDRDTGGFLPLSGRVEIPSYAVSNESSISYKVTGIRSINNGEDAPTEIVIPETVTEMDPYAFSGLRQLAGIHFSSNISRIKEGTFEGCISLKSIVIPDNIVEIGSSAFSGCTGLESIVLPKSLIRIEQETFSGCESLKAIQFSEDLKSICTSAFRNCTSLSSFTIPETVAEIQESVFWGCSALETIEVPSTVSYLGQAVFAACTNLKSLYVRNIQSIDNAFLSDGLLSLEYLYLDGSHIKSPLYVGLHWINLNEYGLNDEDRGFPSLKTIELGGHVETVEQPIGIDASELVIVNSNINDTEDDRLAFYSLGVSAPVVELNCEVVKGLFRNNKNIKEVRFGGQVRSIGHEAFRGTMLSTVTLPASVEDIGAYAFCVSSHDSEGLPTKGLTDVYTYIQEPFAVSRLSFMDYNTDNQFTHATLHVPAGTKEKYESTSAWNEFLNIVEMDEMNSIGGVAAKSHSEATDKYSLTGILQPAFQRGINIIRYGDGSVQKIFVR